MKEKLSFFALVALVGLAPSANASVCSVTTNCTFTFDNTNVAQFGAGPYGTIDLALSGSFINISINLLPGFHLIDTGTHDAFTFNDTLSGSVTVSNLNSLLYSQVLPSPGTYDNPPFSNFNNALSSTCTNGGGCGVQTLTFQVSRTGGFTDVNQLVALSTGSGTAAYFAADVANAAGNTGAIGATGAPHSTSTVPEPVSSTLVGVGLVSLFLLRRRAGRAC